MSTSSSHTHNTTQQQRLRLLYKCTPPSSPHFTHDTPTEKGNSRNQSSVYIITHTHTHTHTTQQQWLRLLCKCRPTPIITTLHTRHAHREREQQELVKCLHHHHTPTHTQHNTTQHNNSGCGYYASVGLHPSSPHFTHDTHTEKGNSRN